MSEFELNQRKRMTKEEMASEYPNQWVIIMSPSYDYRADVKFTDAVVVGNFQDSEIDNAYEKFKNLEEKHWRWRTSLIQSDERLAWNEIERKYRDKWVIVTSIEWEDSANIKSAIILGVYENSSEVDNEMLRLWKNGFCDLSAQYVEAYNLDIEDTSSV